MSFTRFLTDNVYFNLPGNRGRIRRHVNLMITMVLCGIWHGSTWTFVAWGALHGLLLVSNHLWRALRESLTWKQKAPVAARVFTMFAVMASWVLFGSRTWTGVTHIFRGMLGGAGMGRVPSVEACLWLAGLGIVACAGPNSQEIVRSTGKFLRSFTDGKRSIEWSWIAPGALVLWICGILFWLSQTSPASPFIYAIF